MPLNDLRLPSFQSPVVTTLWVGAHLVLEPHFCS